MADEPNFGQRMAARRRELGITNPGRRPIAEKYKGPIEAAERTFARALPSEAGRFIDELAAKEPEECPHHHRVLSCSAPQCSYSSQRTVYNHQAAQYVFDRLMGKPTTRSENYITVRLVQQLIEVFAGIFVEVNALDDPATRSATFAERLRLVSAEWSSGPA